MRSVRCEVARGVKCEECESEVRGPRVRLWTQGGEKGTINREKVICYQLEFGK